MQVLAKIKSFDINSVKVTVHAGERKSRMQHVKGTAIVDVFLVDKNHANGNEIHIITNEAEVLIVNERTNKLITVLLARPGQVRRYYEQLNLRAPRELVDIARENQLAGKNYL